MMGELLSAYVFGHQSLKGFEKCIQPGFDEGTLFEHGQQINRLSISDNIHILYIIRYISQVDKGYLRRVTRLSPVSVEAKTGPRRA